MFGMSALTFLPVETFLIVLAVSLIDLRATMASIRAEESPQPAPR